VTDPGFEPSVPFSDTDINEIEAELGRKLPDSYCKFVKSYGGAFVGGLVDGSGDLPVLHFYGASKKGGVLDQLRLHTDLKEDRILPIARCELGNLYVFDQENAVHYINYYGGRTSARKVADSFQEFIDRIVVTEE